MESDFFSGLFVHADSSAVARELVRWGQEVGRGTAAVTLNSELAERNYS